MPYQSLNPATGEVLKTFAEVTAVQLEAKLAAAVACLAVWRHKTYAERAVIVTEVADLMLTHQEALTRTMRLEMGKRIADARREVALSSVILTSCAKTAERFLAPANAGSGEGRGAYRKQPDRDDFCGQIVELSFLTAGARDVAASDDDLPLGGVKTSGYDCELGYQQFVNQKLVQRSAAEAPAMDAATANMPEMIGETA